MDQFDLLKCSEESIKKFDLQVKDKRELIHLINETFFKKPSKTSKEKFETLLLRDKILKLIRHEINQITPESEILEGTCLDMCPEKERFSREHLMLCHEYEFSPGTQQPDHFLMIKEYSRSSADQDLPLSNEMRSLDVLYDTTLYIIDEIITRIESFSSETEFEVNQDLFSICKWYDFVWNRTRSIRKDIIQQRLLINEANPSVDAVLIIEQCARFHIMCAHRLCDQQPDVFDLKINEENLKNCFQSLRQYYEKSHESTSNLPESPNESEFRSFIILLNLTESNILGEIQRWPKQIRHSKYVQFALNCYFAYNSKNYVKFFRLIGSDDCEYLQACVLHRHFYKARADAFKNIFSAFKENKEKLFPIGKIVEILGFDDAEEAVLYANMFGLDITDDGLSFRMRQNDTTSIFNLTKSDQDTLRLRRSKTLVENKFYINHFFSNVLNNRDRLALIISGLSEIDQVKSSRFLSPDHVLTSSFDNEGFFIPDEVEQYLDKLRLVKNRQPIIQPKPAVLTLKPANEIRRRDEKEIEEKKPIEAPNLFGKLIANKPKQANLFENLITRTDTQKIDKPIFRPVPIVQPPPQPAPPIQIDMNKIADEICQQFIDTQIKKTMSEFLNIYSKVSKEYSDLFLEFVLKDLIQTFLIEEILEQQNLKYKNEALNRISVNIGENLLNEVVYETCIDYFRNVQYFENVVYDDIQCLVFQKEFDFILKQIASEISTDLILDQLAERIYFNEKDGLFNEDLLLTLHDTIYDQTRLNLNVNTELYLEIKQSINENRKYLLFQKWRLKLSLKLLNKELRRSMNPTLSFLIKYAEFLLENLGKIGLIKTNLFKNVHCEQFLKNLELQTINFRRVFMQILLDNYFSIINNQEKSIMINLPDPIQEICIKTVLFTTRPEIYNKFFKNGSSQLIETIAVNLFDPKEYTIKFCLKKYQNIKDLNRANSLIFTIENFNSNFDFSHLAKIPHILFISLFSRDKSEQYIRNILKCQRYFLVCPLEDKNYFLIDEMFNLFMRQVILDPDLRSPNLSSVSLRDLLYDTVVKFLDNSKTLMLDQCLNEFSQRLNKLIKILLDEKSFKDNYPIEEFVSEDMLKLWGTKEIYGFLNKKLFDLFKINADKDMNSEYFRSYVELIIENEKVNIGNESYSFDNFLIYADVNLIKSIDWIEKEELNRKYNLVNLKRRISAEGKVVHVKEKEPEEKSPKRLMIVNEKVEDQIGDILKTVDFNFENLMSEIQKEKENFSKMECKLDEMVKEDNDENNLDSKEKMSTFDSFMKKLNEEKSHNDNFNNKLNHILWKC
ncbi:unnamed protein product [Brachionus calyciflorus]|uniref:SAC3/GANP/THP3 conserved domain-containing protein n=1 Tax=Brachionus calyciflorus TaxID=104777 RepID=A0A813WMU6_9BILA|nr:unnamed protein product [Brachionus calyciflorus]